MTTLFKHLLVLIDTSLLIKGYPKGIEPFLLTEPRR